MIGRIPLITEEQMERAIALALSGLLGYYGRAAVLTWEDMVSVENARAQALRAKGVTTALIEWRVPHLMHGPDALREEVVMEAYRERRGSSGV